ncbi:Gastric triacylglycerol lipase precursor, putative [Pediculus humanus corporis]|uniref:Lipase n=1 Tax=Pediculus humanus subsp. corporis TaxID=121224 RepID=E0V9B5_PEDHC|nr:Gastric triacylglycerol lipase precursor, putative [Pediculus humanus corporis]EEB09971.1 Gastric triacylglycerol lipase precursor, putative [Pediculus humanus corporis]
MDEKCHNSFVIKFFFLFNFLIVVGQTVQKYNQSPNEYLNTLQIIKKYGYPAEAHMIETEDGYLIEMHRIPHGKNKTMGDEGKKPPVFLQHGLFCSSEFFLLTVPNNSLAFILADLGFDVWLGNVRGNIYSRANVKLKPDEYEFWDYTWHECGVYDISSQIDFVLQKTNEKKLIYVGHSMGTTMYFVLMSEKPEYNKKIQVAQLMAPIAYMKNIISKLFGDGEFISHGGWLTRLGKIICEPLKIEVRLCLSVIYLLVGSDPREYDQAVLDVLLNHFSGGYSVKGVNHYAQLVQSGKFRQYDYGKLKNFIQYGSVKPPDYNLKNITAPTYLYLGKNDLLSTIPDVKRLVKQMTSVKNTFLVDYPKFSHLDFVLSKNVKKELYDYMINDIMSNL